MWHARYIIQNARQAPQTAPCVCITSHAQSGHTLHSSQHNTFALNSVCVHKMSLCQVRRTSGCDIQLRKEECTWRQRSSSNASITSVSCCCRSLKSRALARVGVLPDAQVMSVEGTAARLFPTWVMLCLCWPLSQHIRSLRYARTPSIAQSWRPIHISIFWRSMHVTKRP